MEGGDAARQRSIRSGGARTVPQVVYCVLREGLKFRRQSGTCLDGKHVSGMAMLTCASRSSLSAVAARQILSRPRANAFPGAFGLHSMRGVCSLSMRWAIGRFHCI